VEYYENKEHVEKYIRFTPSHDGSFLIDLLVGALPAGSTVLELGMGPGNDFDVLSRSFEVTGSDFSREFLRLNRARNAEADLLHLDARTLVLDTDRTFDGIYSNKALIHLGREALRESFSRQHAVLNDAGLVLHSFWYGEGEEEYSGLRMVKHTEEELTKMLEGPFNVLDIGRHAKMAENDSVYVLARKAD